MWQREIPNKSGFYWARIGLDKRPCEVIWKDNNFIVEFTDGYNFNSRTVRMLRQPIEIWFHPAQPA